jgi:hypothetical protein
MKVENSILQGRIWWLKLHVAPNNGDRYFLELFNVRKQKA